MRGHMIMVVSNCNMTLTLTSEVNNITLILFTLNVLYYLIIFQCEIRNFIFELFWPPTLTNGHLITRFLPDCEILILPMKMRGHMTMVVSIWNLTSTLNSEVNNITLILFALNVLYNPIIFQCEIRNFIFDLFDLSYWPMAI
jgi:hypothetical protein